MKRAPEPFDDQPTDTYANRGDSCPNLCRHYAVEVREFVLLACINDLDRVTSGTLSKSTGLSRRTVQSCIELLSEKGLVRMSDQDPPSYVPTSDGFALLRKASRIPPV